MPKIELTTPHNVVITYDLATFWNRFFAFWIDIFAKVILMLILWQVVILLTVFQSWFGWSDSMFSDVGMALSSIIIQFYTLICEGVFNGQTLGKLALGIRVVRLDGEKASWQDLLMRWTFRVVDVLGIGILMILSSEKAQRLGGMLSDTIVVKKNPELNISLQRLLNISSTSEYEPIHTNVTDLREKDLLLIKQTLDRYKKYRNPEHLKALEFCAKKVKSLLEIQTDLKDEVFLRTILKDYIVLTR